MRADGQSTSASERGQTAILTVSHNKRGFESLQSKLRLLAGVILLCGGGMLAALSVAAPLGSQARNERTAPMRSAATAAPGIISTVAGGGRGDGAPAAVASFDHPHHVAIDSAGNLYVVDGGDSRVRKIDSATGTITNYAGNGTFAFSGDGGPATSTSLNVPQGLAVDTAGDLYIADGFNGRIRKVDHITGIITTVAGNGDLTGCGVADEGCPVVGDGGPATSARLFNPGGVAFDSAGNLYIADNQNYRVRKVDRGTGIITTVAGNGKRGCVNASGCDGGFSSNGDDGPAIAAFLIQAVDVAVDSADTLYISDSGSNRIRKVDSLGIITTYAGDGQAGFSGDGGPATSASLNYPSGIFVDGAGNLYISDFVNGRIRKVAAAASGDGTHQITTVAGKAGYCVGSFCYFGFAGDGGPATEATLDKPVDMIVDPAGNLFIADSFRNNRIRKVDSAGIITTFAGGGAYYPYRHSGDGGPAINAGLNFPVAPTFDAAGNLFFADLENNRVRKMDTSGLISTVAGDGYQVCDLTESGRIECRGRYAGDVGPAAEASLDAPAGVAVDGAGNVYILDAANHRVRKVDASGVITTFAGGNGNQGQLGLCGPGDNNRIRSSEEIGDGGPATSACVATSPGHSPQGLAVDRAGNVYIADFWNRRIRRVDTAGIITTWAGSGATGSTGDGGPATNASFSPGGSFAIDAAGNLFIIDIFGVGRVRKIDANPSADGTRHISAFAGDGTEGYGGDGGPATAAQLGIPIAVAVDVAGSVFISDLVNWVIRKVDPAGIITTIAGRLREGFDYAFFCGDGGPAASACLYSPQGLAVDGTGNLYIADSGSDRIRRIEGVAAIPVELLTVESRKLHGIAGPFGIDLPLAGKPGIESRSGGASNAHEMILTFANAVTFGGASVNPAAGKTAELEGSPVSSGDGKKVTLKLKNVSNAQTITVTLAGVSDGTRTNDISVEMGVLFGDTTGDGVVNSGDITQTRRQSGQVTTESNKRIDLSADGVIDSGDITLVRRQSGAALP